MLLCWWKFCNKVRLKLHERTHSCGLSFKVQTICLCKLFVCHMLIIFIVTFESSTSPIHQDHQCHHHHLQHQHQHHQHHQDHHITTISRTCKAAFLCLPLRRGRAATARRPTREIATIEPTEAIHTELSEWTGECKKMSTLSN